MKKILTILFVLVSLVSLGQAKHKEKFGVYSWEDTAYFKIVPYNSGAGMVHLVMDTVVTSPTYGKLFRKTASGGITADNGITANTGTNVQLGNPSVGVNPLTHLTYIDVDDFELSVLTTGTTSRTMSISGGDQGLSVFGNTVGQSVTSASLPLWVIASNTGASTVQEALIIDRQTFGSVSDGIGSRLAFNTATSSSSDYTTLLISRWKNATNSARTAEFAITSVVNTVSDTLYTAGNYVTLTESSATKFTSTTIATGKIQGGEILITVEANDATDFQARTLRFIWSAVNKGGTITATISAVPEEVVSTSAVGTLTVTITAVDAGSGVLDFKANAVSSLSQSTLRATYQTFKNF